MEYEDYNHSQKVKFTKATRKAWKEYDEVLDPISDSYYGFCQTLYPERNKKIHNAEQKMQEIIDKAKEEYERTREEIMSEFENHPEVLRLEKILDDARKEQWDIKESKISAVVKLIEEEIANEEADN